MDTKSPENRKKSLKKRKKLIAFLSILTLVGLITSTYAWFTVNTFAGVDTLDLHISVSAQLKVSMENNGDDLDKYVKVITNEMIDGYLGSYNTSLSDTLLDPVTSVDGRTFTNKRGAERTPNNRSYLEFECYFIATEDMWVHLTTEDTEVGADDGTSVTSSSNLPKAEVVQCTRVGFATDDSVAVYEPNKATQINALSTFDLPSGKMVYTNSTRLFHLNEMEPKKVTIRLWIDGEDPQCDDDVQDADLSVKLGFIGCDENNVPIS